MACPGGPKAHLGVLAPEVFPLGPDAEYVVGACGLSTWSPAAQWLFGSIGSTPGRMSGWGVITEVR